MLEKQGFSIQHYRKLTKFYCMGKFAGPIAWALLRMIWLQLFLMHDLLNGHVKFMHGMPTLICAGWGCACNHMQDHLLKPQSTDSRVLSTVMSVDIKRPVCQLLNDGYTCATVQKDEFLNIIAEASCRLYMLDGVSKHICHCVYTTITVLIWLVHSCRKTHNRDKGTHVRLRRNSVWNNQVVQFNASRQVT